MPLAGGTYFFTINLAERMKSFVGLLPILWGHGTGADVMKRIAAPMIGGVITSAILDLLIYPAVYTIWKWRWEVRPALAAQTKEV